MACPEQDTLVRLLAGDLDESTQVEVSAHLEDCSTCRKALDRLATEGESFSELPRVLQHQPTEMEPGLKRVLAEEAGVSHETMAEGQSGSRDHDLSFLAPSTNPNHLGRLDHYEVQEVIGKGGFGIVLKAFDERLHRVVAIKVLSPAYAANGAARKRFIREARTAAAVKNEHVVGIYDVEDDAQPPYLAMEMIDGVSLQDKIDKQGTLELKEILRIGMQMAEGLAAAHKQGLVHRDIKPANILLENGVERVKITDFGLARAVDDASVTQSGTVAGTPMYMSPEQAEGLPIDHRSDLFSLGTVMYAMATGHPPFRASGTHAVLKRVIDASPRPIREINNEVPEWLCDIIGKLHAKKPEDRYQSAKEVAELLGQRLSDVQAGRAIGEPSRVSDRVTSAALSPSVAPTPSAPAPGRSWVAALGLFALGFMGAWFTFAGIMMVTTPPQNRTPEGHLFAPITLLGGLSLFSWTVFFGSRRVWVYRLAGVVAAVLIVAALISPLVFDRISPLPSPTGRLVVQTFATQVRVEVIPLDDPDRKFVFPPQDMTSVLMERTVPAGQWKVIAYRGDKVHHQIEFTLGANEQRSINIPALPIEPVGSEPGWVQLFNGKDTSAWDMQGSPLWKFANGILSCKGGELRPIRTEFKNCRIKIEARYFGGEAYLRLGPQAIQDPGGKLHFAHQLIHLHNENDAGKTGSITVHVGKLKTVKNNLEDCTRPGEWFTLEVSYQGKHIQTWVNGKPAAEFTNPDPGAYILGAGLAIGAVGNNSEVEIRKVEVKDLPTDEPGWVQLFNRKDLKGWKYHPKHPGNWTVKDGILSNGGEGNYLYTERGDYGDFHLRAEMLLNGGFSAIFVRAPFGSTWSDSYKQPGLNGYPVIISEPSSPHPTGTILNGANLESLAPRGLIELDKWCLLEIIVKGNRITSFIDGKPAATLIDPKLTGAKGHIALQQLRSDLAIRYRKIEIKELPAVDVRPFVVLAREARPEQNFATLSEAAAAALGGDEIEIRGNGPFVTPTVSLNRRLTIRAGQGFRPVIQRQPADMAKMALITTNSALVVEGLEFQDLGAKPAQHGARRLLESVGAPILATNCRFVSTWATNSAVRSPRIEIRNCELICGWEQGAALGWFGPPSNGKFRMQNCVTPNWSLWMYPSQKDLQGVEIEFVGNSFAHDTLLHCYSRGEFQIDGKNPKPFRVKTASNVLRTQHMFAVEVNATPANAAAWPLANVEQLARALLHYEGDRNVCLPGSGYRIVQSTDWKEFQEATKSRADWKKVWGLKDANVLEGEIHFLGGDLRQRATASPQLVTAADFRLTKDSTGIGQGSTGKDRGADIDLIGPGEPYERWKKTPEYREWLDMIRPLLGAGSLPAVEAGWVQLFNGKDLDGWQGDPMTWAWKNGKLVGDTTISGRETREPSFLVSNTSYKDFELRFRARISNHGGVFCGVRVRGRPTQQNDRVVGPVLDIGKEIGGFYTSVEAKSFKAPQNKAKLIDALRLGDNDFYIRCLGKRVTIRVNGVTTLDEECPDIPDDGVLAFEVERFLDAFHAQTITLDDIKIRTH